MLIEAQAAGLPCLASDRVPLCTEVTCCTYLPLDSAVWAEEMCCALRAADRSVNRELFVDAGYDIDAEASKLERFYEEKFL